MGGYFEAFERKKKTNYLPETRRKLKMMKAIQFVIFSLLLQCILASDLDKVKDKDLKKVKDILNTNMINNVNRIYHTWLSWEDFHNVNGPFEITGVIAHLNIKFTAMNYDVVEANFNIRGQFGFVARDPSVLKRHNLGGGPSPVKIKFFPIEKKVQFIFGDYVRVFEMPIRGFVIREIDSIAQLDQYIQN